MLNYISTLKKFEKVKNNVGKNEVLKSCTQKLKAKSCNWCQTDSYLSKGFIFLHNFFLLSYIVVINKRKKENVLELSNLASNNCAIIPYFY